MKRSDVRLCLWAALSAGLILSLSLNLHFFQLLQAEGSSSRDVLRNNLESSTTQQQTPVIIVKPHPHAGARYANGTLGLIVDPSPRRLHQVANKRCLDPKEPSIEGEGGRQVLEKIRGGLLESQSFLQQHHSPSELPRILCLVYTHEGAHDKLRAIAETWGRRCDGFWAASNVTDDSIGAINLLHQGPETYSNMWQKVRSMWAYAYDHYRDQYDYFHICGDDVYLIPENFRTFLASPQVQRLEEGHLDIFASRHAPARKWANVKPRPVLLGMPTFYPKFGGTTYPLGGPGYTLNRAALELFATEGLPNFLPNYTDSREDVFTGSFFTEQGVWTSDTRDDTGAWRYAGNGDAETCFRYDGGGKSEVQPKRLAAKYPGYAYPASLAGVSAQTVAFHLKNPGKRARQTESFPALIYRYHEILYRSSDDDACTMNNHGDAGSHAVTRTRPFDPDRPSGLRLVLLGDSVDRYQYLSLVYFLRWAVWYGEKIKKNVNDNNTPPSFGSYLFHERNGGTWNDYLKESTKMLKPYEACDCYREGSKGDYQHNTTCENRFYYDPVSDNAVAFLWVPGKLEAHGHFEAAEAFRRTETFSSPNSNVDASMFQPFLWRHSTWAGLISKYVAKLRPRPTWLYLNAHYWPNHFPNVGPDVIEAAKNAQMRTIWSTATVSNNFKAQLKFREVDREMCRLADYCLNHTWMETNLTSRDLYDFFHFKPHVYKQMNQRLLSIVINGETE